MQKFFTRHFLTLFFTFFWGSSFAQNSILVNLGSATCSQPTAPVFSLISNPLSVSPSVLTLCDLSNQLPDYFNVFIAYNPKDNKLYIDDIRSGDSSKVWVMDIGLPGSVNCPPAIPLTPTYTYNYVPNNFEFDNNGNLWSFYDYNDTTGLCTMDNFDVTNGNILFTKTFQFPLSNLPTTLLSGDVAILPNGRMFVVFGNNPSQLYEILNYNGVGDATAVYIATMPQNTFGMAYINGLLEITGTDEISSCYYYTYDIANNTLSAQINFQNGQSPIDNTSITPAIGSTKQLINASVVDHNTDDLTYEVYVRNMGNVMLDNINATDDLGAAFGAANVSDVSVSFEPGGNDAGLILNSSYNGTTDVNLLAPGQNLPNQILNNTNYFFKLQIKCRVSNLFYDLIYNNSAIATATIGNGSGVVNVSDSSNNGTSDNVDPNNNGNAGDPGENVPTPFYLVSGTSPVHFINVNATLVNNNSAVVNWTVATPTIDANKFEVEYSTDGKNWNTAKLVNILSANQSNYQFTQENIPSGNIYYRIKEIDNNGFYILSRVVLLNNKKESGFVIFPNPANNYIEISAPYGINGNSTLELFDAIGRKLIDNIITSSTTELNTSKLPNGTYLLRVKNNENITTQKVLIEH